MLIQDDTLTSNNLQLTTQSRKLPLVYDLTYFGAYISLPGKGSIKSLQLLKA